LVGGLLDKVVEQRDTMPTIASRFDKASLDCLSKVTALAGTTSNDVIKIGVVSAALWSDELAKIDNVQKQLDLIKSAYTNIASLMITQEYMSTNTRRTSWEDIGNAADNIKNRKLRNEGVNN
jgi:hypothetical protein